MTGQMKITLLSDMCSSSGENYGSIIDSDVCYDEHGFPYIPSKRIKGCLRECAIELADWGDSSAEAINRIFGKAGGENGSLKISDAFLYNYPLLINDINDHKYKKYLHPQNVLANYTYTRAQTAIDNDTGTAEENSLRFTRVVKKGEQFIFEYSMENASPDDEKFFNRCCKILRRMGLSRTRGFGEIKLESVIDFSNTAQSGDEYIKYNPGSLNDGSQYEISYLIKSESSLLFPNGTGESTELYIPGTSIMGYFANKYIKANGKNDDFDKIFLKNNIVFQNAYISYNKKRYTPVPISIVRYKSADNNGEIKYFDKCYDTTDTEQKKSMGNHFVLFDSDERKSGLKAEVETEINYHHARGEDKSFGNASEGSFYQFKSICKNQVFAGIIRGKGMYIKQILNLIPNDGVLTLGRSNTAQYGRSRIIHEIKSDEIRKAIPVTVNKFTVILNSPLILMDKNTGCYSTSKELLKAEIEKKLSSMGISVALNFVKTFLKYRTVSGFNMKWNLIKPQINAFDAGTVCIFEINENKSIDISELNHINIGEKTCEGYGEIAVYKYSDTEKNFEIKFKDSEKIQEDTKTTFIRYTDVTKKILRRIILKEINLKGIHSANEKYEKYKDSPYALNSTEIGRLTLMLKESATIDEFIKSICAPKDENKTKNDKKKKMFGQLFDYEYNDGTGVIPSVCNIACVRNYFDTDIYPEIKDDFVDIICIDEAIKTYLEGFLSQTKYRLREKEKEETENE